MTQPGDLAALRAQFPILHKVCYLNTGTTGPVPESARQAAGEVIAAAVEEGRSSLRWWTQAGALAQRLRSGYADFLGCRPEDVALTSSATDGIHVVLLGLDLGRGDEIVTSDEEHIGLAGPLRQTARRTGARLRVVPFEEIASAAGPSTRLIACSHVSWMTGKVADLGALASRGALVLIDGAQAVGAIPVDVSAAGCHFYAASGQKWLCGAEGTGCLYVAPEARAAVTVARPSYHSFTGSLAPEPELHADARRFDTTMNPAAMAWSLASLQTLEHAGLPVIFERAATLAAQLASRLRAGGVEVTPRCRSTLVSWSAPDPEAAVSALGRASIAVRTVPRRGLVRASVGAWNTEAEIERVARLASAVSIPGLR